MKIFLSAKQNRRLDGRGDVERAELVYLVSGIADGTADEEVLLAVGRASPPLLGSATRNGIFITRRLSRSEWEVSVDYSPEFTSGGDDTSKYKRAGDEVWLFSSMNRREMRALARSTRSFAGDNGSSPPSPGPWINWNGASGSEFAVSGCEVNTPALQEKCIRTFSPGQISTSYKRAVMELIGKTNSANFHNWSAGEVLFVEASQSKYFRNGKGDWLTDVTFTFAISPNRANVNIASGVTLSNVTGWETVWVRPGIDPDSGAAVVSGAYASVVYASGDFSKLKLSHAGSGNALQKRIDANSIRES